MDDVFASCNDASARAGMRHGLFEWEAQTELNPRLPVTLMISWQPEYDGPLADSVAAARVSWARFPSSELGHRRAAAEEVSGQSWWSRVSPEDMYPASVEFLADGSVEVDYGGIETGGHGFVVEVSPAGQYVGYRIE